MNFICPVLARHPFCFEPSSYHLFVVYYRNELLFSGLNLRLVYWKLRACLFYNKLLDL